MVDKYPNKIKGMTDDEIDANEARRPSMKMEDHPDHNMPSSEHDGYVHSFNDAESPTDSGSVNREAKSDKY